MYNKDKRHLYLMKEGEVYRNTEAAIGVPEKGRPYLFPFIV